jgi:hypothetical protein
MNQPSVNPTDDFAAPSRPRDNEVSGKAVVIGMLSLGIFTTSLLFIYFELHTRPFRPMREAIGREFRHSRPNVEGGQLKGRGPTILRISMSVPFDPYVEDQETTKRIQRVLAIARQYQNLAAYDQVQINLIYFVPEREPRRRSFDWPGKEVAEPLPTE